MIMKRKSRTNLGDRLGTLRDSVLRELTGEDEANSGLDFARRDGGLLGVCGKLGSLGSDTLEDIRDEAVRVIGWRIRNPPAIYLFVRNKTHLLRIAMALLEIPVSGCTCLSTEVSNKDRRHQLINLRLQVI